MRLTDAIRLPYGREAWREVREIWRREGLDPLTIAPEDVAKLADILARRHRAEEAYLSLMTGLRPLAARKRIIGR